jgi:hypothetical protein
MLAFKYLDTHFGIKSLRESRLKISTLDDLNDPFELLPYEMKDRNRRAALYATRKQIAKGRGILCFSSSWRDPVLWAHYADKHRGVCLGFEVPEDKCKAVRYEDHRLKLPSKPSLLDAEALLFTKYSNWSYEQELRVWVALNENENGLYFAAFGSMLNLRRVIAGARCSLRLDELKEAAGSYVGDLTFVKARPGFTEFEIVKDQKDFRNEK